MRMPSSWRVIAWGTGSGLGVVMPGKLEWIYFLPNVNLQPQTTMPTDATNPFGARGSLPLGGETAVVFRLSELARQGLADLDRLPFSIRVLLENALRHAGRGFVTEAHVRDLAAWSPRTASRERGAVHAGPRRPAGLHRRAVRRGPGRHAGRDGADEGRPRPDQSGGALRPGHRSLGAGRLRTARSARSSSTSSSSSSGTVERYQLLKFAQRAFDNFRVVPPGTGIVHQVNLEYLAPVVQLRPQFGELTAYPDTLVGTDSHTTMINGLGVVGWGVGGIEAEAVMLGQPYFMLIPEVIGMKLVGELPLGTTATDLVLTVTQMLRKKGVVDKFVEFYGPGLSRARRWPTAPRSPTWRPSTAPRWASSRWTPRRCAISSAPAASAAVVRAGRALQQGAGTLPHRRDARPRVHRDARARPLHGQPEPRRPQAAAGPGPARRQLKRNFIVNLPALMSAGVPTARKELAESAYSRWMGEGGANVTIGGTARRDARGRSSIPTRRRSSAASSTARTSRCTMAPW